MYKIDSVEAVRGYGESKIGGRPENQDAYGFADTPLGLVITVCDGMGGMQGGSTASAIAVRTIVDDVVKASKDDDPADVIKRAVIHANAEIMDASENNPSLAGMGTTATVLIINKNAAWIGHVGDSRVYQLRNGRKVYRTFDDSLVFTYVKNKIMTEEEARNSANSNVILKALGVSRELDFEVTKHAYLKNDRFILCTDGYWGNMPEIQFLKLVRKKGNVRDIIKDATSQIENAGMLDKNGHFDNLTVAMIDTTCSSSYKDKSLLRLYAGFAAALLAILLLVCGIVWYVNRQPADQGGSTPPDVPAQVDSSQVQNNQDESLGAESAHKDSSESTPATKLKTEVEQHHEQKTDDTDETGNHEQKNDDDLNRGNRFEEEPGDDVTDDEYTEIVYVVKANDNLGRIAREFHVSKDDLMTWNNIKNENKIYKGQKLTIKTKNPR